jgi:hypothetical protein
MPGRDIKRIELDGTAWIEDGKGGEIPVQLVVAPNNSIGVRRLDADQLPGIDQVGGPQPPAPIEPPRGSKKDDLFDTSGLDQS